MGCPSSDDDEPEDQIKVTTPPTGNVALETSQSQSTNLTGPSVEYNGRPLGQTEPHENQSQSLTVQERRSSLPPGLLENGQINSLCGQILRYMGDEQYSMACGRHLRGMGDQLCYNYFIRNALRRSGQFQQLNTNTLHGSHSTPDLMKP